jgi:hypothetical protein
MTHTLIARNLGVNHKVVIFLKFFKYLTVPIKLKTAKAANRNKLRKLG